MADKDKKLQSALKNLSKVTPQKSRSLFQTPVFKIIAMISLLFLIIGFLSPHAQSNAFENDTKLDKSQSPTLNQNLAYLSALKEEEAKKNRLLKEKMREINEKQKAVKPSSYQPLDYRPPNPSPIADKELQARMQAPTTFINIEHHDNSGFRTIDNNKSASQAMLSGKDSNSQFINQNNPIGFIKASKLHQPSYTIAAGQTIEATLETAINSQLPGMVRAITSRDIYSLDGKRLLIPKASRLIGQYSQSQVGATQNRLLIVWNRTQLPNGIIANLNSPSTDTLGRAGLGADNVNHHFIERFGMSALFSVLGAYTANSGVNSSDGYNSASLYRMSVMQGFQKTASDSLNQNRNIPPTLSLHQGHKINVFVAQDINFYDVMRKSA